MSDIGGITGSSSESLQALQTSNVMGKDDFFKMMIAQLQHQDPLNPLDGTAFTAQLAQFSSLEQLTNMNDQLEILGFYQASLNNSQSVNLIGKEITAISDVIIKIDGEPVDLSYNLSENAEQVTIKIYDEGANLVATLGFESQQEGENSVTWSSNVAASDYTFEVSAIDANGDAISAYTSITGEVTGVAFKGGFYPYLSVNGQDIPLGNIISVNEPKAEG